MDGVCTIYSYFAFYIRIITNVNTSEEFLKECFSQHLLRISVHKVT